MAEEINWYDGKVTLENNQVFNDKGDIVNNVDGTLVKSSDDIKASLPADKPEVTTILIDEVSYNLNESGDAVDKDNKVVKTADEIKSLSEEVVLSFDKTKGFVNKDNEIVVALDTLPKDIKFNDLGDQIDDNGTVVKTANELIKDLDIKSEDDEISMDDIMTHVGIKPMDRENKPIEYEMSIAGLASYVKDSITTTTGDIRNNVLGEFFDTYPAMVSAFNYVRDKGSLAGFIPSIDYKEFTLDPTSKEQCKEVIIKNQMEIGNTKEVAETLYTAWDDAGKTTEQAKLADIAMKARQDEAVNTANAASKQDQEEIARRNTTMWEEVKDKVLSGSINGHIIPEIIKVTQSDGKINNYNRQDFFDYVNKPIAQVKGKSYTQAELEADKKTLDEELWEYFLQFVKYDTSEFIANAVDTKFSKAIKSNRKGSKAGTVKYIVKPIGQKADAVDNIK